jgi:hypothetical protein
MPQQQVRQPHQAQDTTAQQLTLPAQHLLLSPWQEGLQLQQQPVQQCRALGATTWQDRAHRGLLSAYRAKHGRHVSGTDGDSGQLLRLSLQAPLCSSRMYTASLATVAVVAVRRRCCCDSASTCTDDHYGCSSGNTFTIISAAYRSVLHMSLQLKPQPHQARWTTAQTQHLCCPQPLAIPCLVVVLVLQRQQSAAVLGLGTMNKDSSMAVAGWGLHGRWLAGWQLLQGRPLAATSQVCFVCYGSLYSSACPVNLWRGARAVNLWRSKT